jgi:hypothetical protein
MSDTITTSTAPAPVVVVERGPRNGLGIASFVTGITGSVLGMIPILGIPALLLGLIGFGLGLGGVRRLRKGRADNKVLTVIGVLASVLAVVLGIVGLVIVDHAFGQLNTAINSTPAN